jgi:hypothetical protein
MYLLKCVCLFVCLCVDWLVGSELLKARVECREPEAYDATYWSSVVQVPSTKGIKKIPSWIDDDAQGHCSLCNAPFSFLNRRHHCRRCGRLVCKQCAPKDNSRPITEWGMREPVRHCKECYRSPVIDWKDA